LEAAKRAPVQIPAQILLPITQWVLVHRIDVIDAAQLLHAKAAAARAAAGSAKQEQKPLVLRLALPAVLALPDGVKDEPFAYRAANTYQCSSAGDALSHL